MKGDDDKVNILLVDDQPGKLLTYQAILAELGENLVVAGSARAALDLLLRTDVALAIIDVCLPELDGFELAAMIREHPRFEKTAIMFVSGVAISELDRIKGYGYGAVDYVPVPVVPELLRAKVRVFVDLYRKTRELERLNQELEARVADRVAELHRNEQRLRIALDAARMGWWDYDARADRVVSSENAGALLDVPLDVTPEDLVHRVHPDDRERLLQAITDGWSDLAPRAAEFRFRAADGEHRWILVAGQVVRGDDGEPSRALGVVLDISDRKAAELALQEADRRKDEFIAMLSHELRNPLAPMRTALQLLRSAQVGEAERERARDMIERQLEHLVRLVDDLLDVSRISRGVITLHREPLDLAAVVQGAVEVVTPVLQARAHELEVDVRPGVEVLGDPTRLAQIVGNVLQNAAKYTPDGGRIRVALDQEGDEAVLRVTDTGVGIPPDMLRAVFELFTQVDGSTHRSRGGLGIGLALVDRLVAMHGGTVAARSEGVDRGTELEVRLPRHVGAPAPEVVAVEPARRTPTPAVRVLIVDDNVDAAEAAAMLLELEGHEVRTASDGLQALDLGADFGPELVLLDIGMPHLDGYETARRMREQPWGRATRLVAVTGWGQARDRDRTAQSGFDDHLVKPVGSDELLELVARAAKRSA